MRYLRLTILTVPLPVVLGFLWTAAIFSTETMGETQSPISLGVVVLLIVIPLTFLLSAAYAFFILNEVGNPEQKSIKNKFIGLHLLQMLGTLWGFAVLGGENDSAYYYFLAGTFIAAAFIVATFSLFPKDDIIDTKDRQWLKNPAQREVHFTKRYLHRP